MSKIIIIVLILTFYWMSTVAQTESSDDMSAMTTKAMQKERTKEDIQKYFESQKNIFKFAVCTQCKNGPIAGELKEYKECYEKIINSLKKLFEQTKMQSAGNTNNCVRSGYREFLQSCRQAEADDIKRIAAAKEKMKVDNIKLEDTKADDMTKMMIKLNKGRYSMAIDKCEKLADKYRKMPDQCGKNEVGGLFGGLFG